MGHIGSGLRFLRIVLPFAGEQEQRNTSAQHKDIRSDSQNHARRRDVLQCIGESNGMGNIIICTRNESRQICNIRFV